MTGLIAVAIYDSYSYSKERDQGWKPADRYHQEARILNVRTYLRGAKLSYKIILTFRGVPKDTTYDSVNS